MRKQQQEQSKVSINTLLETSPQKNRVKKQFDFNFTVDGLPSVIAKKVAKIVKVLNSDKIDILRLKQLLSEGIPDEAARIRQYCWKLILGYLPDDKNNWKLTIEKQTKTYFDFVEMFLPENRYENYPLILKKDHPQFNEFAKDFALWEQIQKDTSRTHAEMSFFAMSSKQIMIPFLTSSRRQKFKLINGQDELAYQSFLGNKKSQRKTYRYDYMTRILFIYSKLNQKIQYVQGMNEILAPIFYLVNIGKPTNEIQEASCFFMFNNAISDIIELHIKDLDRSNNGIYGKMNQVNEMLVVIEPQVWTKLQKLKIDPFFYCFRWVTLLYAQDFALFDTLRIWESIFSSSDRVQFINFIAIAIIISSKDVIMNGEFTSVLEHLQNIKSNLNVNFMIEIANELFAQFKDQDFNSHASKTKKAIQRREKKQKKQQMKKIKEQQESKKDQEEQVGLFKRISGFVDKFF